VGNSSTRWTAGFSLLLVAGILTPVGAQEAIDSVCMPRFLDDLTVDEAYWQARFPPSLASQLSPLEEEGEWGSAAHRILALYQKDAAFFGPESGLEEEYGLVLDAVETFVERLSRALAQGKEQGVPDAVLFDVASDPETRQHRILGQSLIVPRNSTRDQFRSLCWVVHNVGRLHTRLTEDARLRSQMQMKARVHRWNSYNEKGLTPLPWELALNEMVGWMGTRKPLEPPKLQLIALRPSVGVEVNSDLEDRVNVVSIEALGFVTYVNDGAWYLGASLLWTSPKESTSGWGALVHVAPWLKGGPVWRDVDDDGERELRWTVSIDAFDLLNGAPASLLEAAGLATGGRAGN
jgi:hypothetical protein